MKLSEYFCIINYTKTEIITNTFFLKPSVCMFVRLEKSTFHQNNPSNYLSVKIFFLYYLNMGEPESPTQAMPCMQDISFVKFLVKILLRFVQSKSVSMLNCFSHSPVDKT